jgi:mannose-6-phosphate isomerase
MKVISLLKNSLQDYAWGSTEAISKLTGKPNKDNKPQAEMWMGAHPKAPSKVFHENAWLTLLDMIEKYPIEMLGEKTAVAFGNQLPFLFKVLAAEKPLSIQVHPNTEQAKKGFARENRFHVPLDAFNRNYQDENHKPECLCALTPFWAMNGFRPVPDILTYLEALCPNTLVAARNALEKRPDPHGLEDFFKTLLMIPPDPKKTIIEKTVKQASKMASQDPVHAWILRLYNEYREDMGILSPALLNLICLEPGQAMYLPAGRLHSYLQGLGIEIMANSDNVLRAGCTQKHLDVPELLRVVDFNPEAVEILTPVPGTSESEVFYPTPAD